MSGRLKDMSATNCTEEVLQIGQLHIEGNIVPIEWFKSITYQNGTPDTNAILILSDILYWYRPTVIRDEATSAFLGYKKKFHEDILRRSYSDFERLFGFSKKQARDCLIRLEELGLIKRVFRTIETSLGPQNNVMYIKIFPENIKLLTYETPPSNLKVTRLSPKSKEVVPLKEGPDNLKGSIILKKTYTTTENTTKTSTLSNVGGSDKPENKQERESKNLQMLKIWQEVVLKNTKELELNPERENKLSKVYREILKEDLNKWLDVCKNVTRSKFLMGEAKNSTFAATLDWVCEGYNATKILEGDYRIGDRDMRGIEEAVTVESTEYSLTYEKIKSESENSETLSLKAYVLKTLGLVAYKSWFQDVCCSVEGDAFILKATSKFQAEQIEKKFKTIIERFLSKNALALTLKIEGREKF